MKSAFVVSPATLVVALLLSLGVAAPESCPCCGDFLFLFDSAPHVSDAACSCGFSESLTCPEFDAPVVWRTLVPGFSA